MTVPLACSCGAVRGVLRNANARNGSRLVCMCDDCQTYAHHLGRAGDILDAHGGTEVYQTYPARLGFTQGSEPVRCLRLSPKGLMRWHTGCCRTPIGNTFASAEERNHARAQAGFSPL